MSAADESATALSATALSATALSATALSRRRQLWWALAAVTGLVVASITGLALVGKLAALHSSAGYTSTHPLTLLWIDGGRASVEIDTGPAGQLTLRQHLSWVGSRPRVDRHWEGDILVVSVTCPSPNPLDLLDCQADIRIQVPADTAVRSTATSGATTVAGISGPLDLRSRSGPIESDGLLSTDAQARSSSGPITLNFTSTPRRVTAQSDSGPIDIGVPRGAHYRAEAHSNSGPASVDDDLDGTPAAGTLTATSSSGPVDIAYVSSAPTIPPPPQGRAAPAPPSG